MGEKNSCCPLWGLASGEIKKYALAKMPQSVEKLAATIQNWKAKSSQFQVFFKLPSLIV